MFSFFKILFLSFVDPASVKEYMFVVFGLEMVVEGGALLMALTLY